MPSDISLNQLVDQPLSSRDVHISPHPEPARWVSVVLDGAGGGVGDACPLVQARRAARLGGAAVDVFEGEPDVDPRLVGLEQVVLWTLNKNPADRPADAEALISALEAVRATILAGAPSERTASFAALAAAVPAGAGVAAAAALDPAPVTEEPPPTDHRDPLLEPDGGAKWIWILLALVLLAGVGAGAYLLTRPAATKIVPTVVGEQVSVAQAQIQNAGFTPNLISRTARQPAGTVILQDPLGGTKAAPGSTVSLTVSQGPGNTSVPSVAGLPQPQAVSTLTGQHLRIARIESESSVATAPGSMSVTRTLNSSASFRSPSLMARTANLVPLYTAPFLLENRPATEPTLTMCPRLRRAMPGYTARIE